MSERGRERVGKRLCLVGWCLGALPFVLSTAAAGWRARRERKPRATAVWLKRYRTWTTRRDDLHFVRRWQRRLATIGELSAKALSLVAAGSRVGCARVILRFAHRSDYYITILKRVNRFAFFRSNSKREFWSSVVFFCVRIKQSLNSVILNLLLIK